MKSGGELLTALFAVMLVVGGGAWLFWKHGAAFDCADRVVEEVPSPDGALIAARWERSCGGDVATHVSLRPRTLSFEPSDPDDVYVAKGAQAVAVRWDGPASLAVDAPVPSVIGERTKWRNVAVAVRAR
jgi:hypothetical protein